MEFGKDEWRTFERGAGKEWLVTNGLGGYACGTLINANTRKYHSLLMAAHNPPGLRVLHVAKLDECIETPSSFYNLAVNETGGGVSDRGFLHLQRVVCDPFPTFIYSMGDITVRKTVFMPYGHNAAVVLYKVQNGLEKATLRLTPMINDRGYHFITHEGQITFAQKPHLRSTEIAGRPEFPPLKLACSRGRYYETGYWFKGMYYRIEAERGENPYEDHYVPGYFEIVLQPREHAAFTFSASVEAKAFLNGEELLEAERERVQVLIEKAGFADPFAQALVVAADAFIVLRKSTGTKTIIAGYPWFTDWGRDTMISLPGLTLVTGRYEEARQILLTYARQANNGLLPNAFKIGAREAMYNTVDASLWFFNAVYKYLQYTDDYGFIRREIFAVLRDIVAWYVRGTDFNIGIDDDGLVRAGAPDVQLTWMDAKIGDWVVTPRHGKPVEIQALWYNALKVLEHLCEKFDEEFPYRGLAEKVKDSFHRRFWVYGWPGGERWLCDVVTGHEQDARVRPNQLLAASLPFSMLDREQSRDVVRKVWRELYATYGLRSLSPRDPDYRGVYIGDRVRRDGSYHQGTAWSWLVGPFITAYRRAHGYSPESGEQARAFIQPFEDHLRDHGVGSISEIFDGDEPIYPRGCFAQAWGVGELLRAYVEDVLEAGYPIKTPVRCRPHREDREE